MLLKRGPAAGVQPKRSTQYLPLNGLFVSPRRESRAEGFGRSDAECWASAEERTKGSLLCQDNRSVQITSPLLSLHVEGEDRSVSGAESPLMKADDLESRIEPRPKSSLLSWPSDRILKAIGSLPGNGLICVGAAFLILLLFSSK